MAQNGHHVASQETLKQFLLFIKKLQKAGLCTAPEVFAQQSCEIVRVCHVRPKKCCEFLMSPGTRTAKLTKLNKVTWSLTV